MPTYRWIGLTSAIPTEHQGSMSNVLPHGLQGLRSSSITYVQSFLKCICVDSALCTPALFFWSVSENFHFVALFTILPASRVSLLSWRELFAHGHAHLGSQRPLGFCHRSESCKFISEPNPVLVPFPSITLWLSPFLSSSSLHLDCNVFVCLLVLQQSLLTDPIGI